MKYLILLALSACASATPEDLYPDLTFAYVTSTEMEAAGCAPAAYAQVTPERYTEITGSVVCGKPPCSHAVTLSPVVIVLDPGVKPLDEVLDHELRHVLLGCTTGDFDSGHKSEVWR